MPTIAFVIPLPPKPSNKRKAFVINGMARVVQDKGVVQHQAQIAACAAQHRPASPIVGAVTVSIVCVMPRPANLCAVSKRTGLPLSNPGSAPHTTRPDTDNLAKSCLDGLRGWWGDDAQVWDLRIVKRIAAFGESPCYQIEVSW